jgi:hypothetical protein
MRLDGGKYSGMTAMAPTIAVVGCIDLLCWIASNRLIINSYFGA